MLIALVAVGAVLALAVVARVRAAAAEREWLKRHPPGPNGIIAGAEPIYLAGGSAAVLLLHGAGDTPQSMRYLAVYLHERGYAVHAPLLPGHGLTLRAFAESTADEWQAGAREAYAALQREYAWVAIVAQSMGGALGVQLAAENREVPALGLVSPYLAMPGVLRWAARLAPLWGPVYPYPRSQNERSIRDDAERALSLGYGIFPAHALRELWRAVRRGVMALPRVSTPTLVVQSREDNRIAVGDAERAFALLGASEKEIVWVEKAGHVLTVDYGREHVFYLMGEWLDSHGGSSRHLAPPEAVTLSRDRPDWSQPP